MLQDTLTEVRARPYRADGRGIGQRAVHIEQHRTQHERIIASSRDRARIGVPPTARA
jgi:hypothetical protein